MGCLNSEGQFSHWFANIHFSGACNRSCYFCIGQHMQSLEEIDNRDVWPLVGLEQFLLKCAEKKIGEVNLTGSNTDPLLYKHLPLLTSYLRKRIPGVVLGLRTNGVLAESKPELLDLFDKVSLSITSLDPEIYKATMGKGSPPNVREILRRHPNIRFKANVVLCPETVEGEMPDVFKTIDRLADFGICTINLREPYGQTRIGNPIERLWIFPQSGILLGMPYYQLGPVKVVYWDVHYVEVESVNLYANGIISETYPVTKGHHPTGEVKDQTQFKQGRQFPQWKLHVLQ